MVTTPSSRLFYFSLALFFLSALSLAEEFHWSIELIAHFREYLLMLSALTLIVFFRRISLSSWSTYFLVASFLIHFVALAFFWLTTAEPPVASKSTSVTYKIFLANINSSNRERHLLLEYLEKSEDDTVVLHEVTKAWGEALATQKNFAFAKFIPLESNFGIAVLSRFPIEVLDVLTDRENMIPHLIVKNDLPGQPLNLATVHAFPPIGGYGHLINQRHLETIASKVRELRGPVLVCGDFNSTPWTRRFSQFLDLANLNFESTLSSIIRSWPNIALLPKIPIDFCLTRDMSIIDVGVGPNIGSDHKSIQYKLQL
jgi:endonuclease/exonuclease/phosphatase (EEP) superfamily protein YafD